MKNQICWREEGGGQDKWKISKNTAQTKVMNDRIEGVGSEA